MPITINAIRVSSTQPDIRGSNRFLADYTATLPLGNLAAYVPHPTRANSWLRRGGLERNVSNQRPPDGPNSWTGTFEIVDNSWQIIDPVTTYTANIVFLSLIHI